jgi:hypothetical protein
MKLCEQADSGLMKPATLFRDAAAVSKQAAGPLQKKADFFSRFFSVLIALETGLDQHEETRISETLRQEWLETDFSVLLDRPEARPSQAQWHAAEPARTQVSGRRTFAEAHARSWKSSALKRKAKLSEREFNAWLANIPATGFSGSPVRKQQSPVRWASDPPVSSTTVSAAEPQEKPLS